MVYKNPYKRIHIETYTWQSMRLLSVSTHLKNKLPFVLWFRRTYSFQSKTRFLSRSLSFVLFLFFFSLFTCCLERNHAIAFQAEVLPHEIKPGDAFILKVTDVPASSHPPIAHLSKKQLYFSNCGKACFIAIGAIEIKTEPGAYTINLLVGKEKKKLTLVVKPAHFPTLNITLPDEQVFLSPENLKRVKKEEKKLHDLFQRVSEKLWNGGFVLPLVNDFSTSFGTKRIMNKKRVSIHRGLDIMGKMGENVKASNHGRVVLAEELFFGGNTVIIDHGQGIYTIYMHLSEFNVQSETILSKGDTIGFVGASGRATGPHLHFGVKIHNISANPVSLVELNL